jgi:hypothetical protein
VLSPIVELSLQRRTRWMGWKPGGRSRMSGDRANPNGRKPSPCQGEGRGFESRLPLQGNAWSGREQPTSLPQTLALSGLTDRCQPPRVAEVHCGPSKRAASPSRASATRHRHCLGLLCWLLTDVGPVSQPTATAPGQTRRARNVIGAAGRNQRAGWLCHRHAEHGEPLYGLNPPEPCGVPSPVGPS